VGGIAPIIEDQYFSVWKMFLPEFQATYIGISSHPSGLLFESNAQVGASLAVVAKSLDKVRVMERNNAGDFGVWGRHWTMLMILKKSENL